MIFLHAYTPATIHFQEAEPGISEYDYAVVQSMRSRWAPGYPPKVGRYLMRWETLAWVDLVAQHLSDPNRNATDYDFAFLQHLAKRYAMFNNEPSLKLTETLKKIQFTYQTRFGYNPTPELTNTPDHHWAKISLDNLYRNQILIGESE